MEYNSTDAFNMMTVDNKEKPVDALVKDIAKNWAIFDKEKITKVMSSKVGSNELVKYIASMSDIQLQAVFPLMSPDQIRVAVPKLQLQHQGVAVLSLNPNQVKCFVDSISSSDRDLLMQNITLLTTSTTKPSENEEMQSVIGFIDPLAMAIAVEHEDIADKVIDATCIMTCDQIQVLIPLLKIDQLKTTLEIVESNETLLPVARKMITKEQKDALIETLEYEFAGLLDDVDTKLDTTCISNLPLDLERLELEVRGFCDKNSTEIVEKDYKNLSDRVTNAKKLIENLQKESRAFLKKLKVPFVVIDESRTELLLLYKNLLEQVQSASNRLRSLYQIIDKGNLKDGIVHKLNQKWETIKDAIKEKSLRESDNSITEDDSIFTDADSSVILYEAVKAIGNPSTIGSIYNITWSQIVECGFRNDEDFKTRGISTLKELEDHIKGLHISNEPLAAAKPPL